MTWQVVTARKGTQAALGSTAQQKRAPGIAPDGRVSARDKTGTVNIESRCLPNTGGDEEYSEDALTMRRPQPSWVTRFMGGDVRDSR